MPRLWTTTDCRGRIVTLDSGTWDRHVVRRPEISALESIAKLTVERPNLCTREADGSINYYRRGDVPGRPNAYLHVVARDGFGQTEVRTACICFAVDPFEEILCNPTLS